MSHGSLKRHLTTCQNIDKDKFVCDICQSSFIRKDRLQEHIQGKHNEPKYLCIKCGKRYAWRSSLKAHMRHAHPTESLDD